MGKWKNWTELSFLFLWFGRNGPACPMIEDMFSKWTLKWIKYMLTTTPMDFCQSICPRVECYRHSSLNLSSTMIFINVAKRPFRSLAKQSSSFFMNKGITSKSTDWRDCSVNYTVWTDTITQPQNKNVTLLTLPKDFLCTKQWSGSSKVGLNSCFGKAMHLVYLSNACFLIHSRLNITTQNIQ